MRFYVFGTSSLTRKEIKLLKEAGIIKRRLSRFPQMQAGGENGIPEDSNEEDNKDLLLDSARMNMTTKQSEPALSSRQRDRQESQNSLLQNKSSLISQKSGESFEDFEGTGRLRKKKTISF